MEEEILIKEIETKNIMTKSSLPVGGYSVNPYTGCTHACKYCYASFMKRFTGHEEEWGTFLDIKNWPYVKNPKKYAGQRVVIGSVTDGYLPQEEQIGNTRKLLEQLKDSDAEILICTKSDLVLRDLDLLKQMKTVTVSWSINTLDEEFKNDMDHTSYINICMFGSQAGLCNSGYITKGTPLMITGRLSSSTYTVEKDGVEEKRYSMEVIATEVNFVPRQKASADEEEKKGGKKTA